MTWRHKRWLDDRPVKSLSRMLGCDESRALALLRGTLRAFGRVGSESVLARASLGFPPEAGSLLVGESPRSSDEIGRGFLSHVRSCVDEGVTRREVRASIRVIEEMCSASDFERLRAFLPMELDPLTEDADATRNGE